MSLPPNMRGKPCGSLEVRPLSPSDLPPALSTSLARRQSKCRRGTAVDATQMAIEPPRWWNEALPCCASTAVRVHWWGEPTPGRRVDLQAAPQRAAACALDKRCADGASLVRHGPDQRQSWRRPCTRLMLALNCADTMTLFLLALFWGGQHPTSSELRPVCVRPLPQIAT